MADETPKTRTGRPSERLAKLEEEVSILTEVVLAREDAGGDPEPEPEETTTIEEREPDPADPQPDPEEEPPAAPPAAGDPPPAPTRKPGLVW